MHETMQDRLDPEGDNYYLGSNERFDDYLDTIDNNNMHRRDTQKR